MRLNSVGGVTLLEILIALVVLGGGGLATLSTLSAARGMLRLATIRRQATVLLINRMETLQATATLSGCAALTGMVVQPSGVKESWVTVVQPGRVEASIHVLIPMSLGRDYRDSLHAAIRCA